MSFLPLTEWASALSIAFPDLNSSVCTFSMVQYLIIVQKSLHNYPPAGLLPRARIKLTSKDREARLDVSSRCPLSALSPASQKKRKGKLLKERYKYKMKLESMELSSMMNKMMT